MKNTKNMNKIADSFGAASRSYDSSARLQRYSGKIILPWLPSKNDLTTLDLGCGTGFFTELLAEHYEQVIGMDISSDMLNFASQARKTNIHWLKGSALDIPLEDNSIDLVYSNLVLQWCEPLSKALSEIMRVLKPGGILVFTSLTDGTLFELKQAWQTVDNDRHVIDFLTFSDIESALDEEHATLVESLQQDVVLDYADVFHLARELKGLGANHVSNKKNKGLSSKGAWQKMSESYKEQFVKSDEIYPATYRLYKGMAVKRND